MENLKLKDGTVLEVEQTLSGNELHIIIKDKSLSEVDRLFSKENIERISLENENGEYAIFTGYNATVITKDAEGVIQVSLFAKVPDKLAELENQLLETQEALVAIYENMGE